MIDFHKYSAKPRDNLTISVTAPNGAYVGLMAVDNFFEGSSNDITKEKILKELLHQSSIEIFDHRPDDFDFEDSKLFVLTNAKKQFLESRFSDSDYEDLFETGATMKSITTSTTSTPKSISTSKVRQFFPETWIFEHFVIDESRQKSIQRKVPDIITSWILTGFSLDSVNGLSIASPRKLQVKKNFFIKISVPDSVRLGEIVEVQVVIFNYLDVVNRKPQVKVTMSKIKNEEDSFDDYVNSGEHSGSDLDQFDFIDHISKCTYVSSNAEEVTNVVAATTKASSTTSFHIKPLKAGKIKFHVSAVCNEAGEEDSFEGSLTVEHVGITKYGNIQILIDSSKGKFDSRSYSIELESDIIQDSLKFGASFHVKLLGEKLLNVNHLM